MLPDPDLGLLHLLLTLQMLQDVCVSMCVYTHGMSVAVRTNGVRVVVSVCIVCTWLCESVCAVHMWLCVCTHGVHVAVCLYARCACGCVSLYTQCAHGSVCLYA